MSVMLWRWEQNNTTMKLVRVDSDPAPGALRYFLSPHPVPVPIRNRLL